MNEKYLDRAGAIQDPVPKQRSEAKADTGLPVHAEVQALELSLVLLHERLSELEERLYPVLQEPHPQPETLARDARGGSSLARRIYVLANDAGEASRRVGGLIDRLEV